MNGDYKVFYSPEVLIDLKDIYAHIAYEQL